MLATVSERERGSRQRHGQLFLLWIPDRQYETKLKDPFQRVQSGLTKLALSLHDHPKEAVGGLTHDNLLGSGRNLH